MEKREPVTLAMVRNLLEKLFAAYRLGDEGPIYIDGIFCRVENVSEQGVTIVERVGRMTSMILPWSSSVSVISTSARDYKDFSFHS
jgi:hypothetical protein